MRIVLIVITLSFSGLPSFGQSLFMQGLETPWTTGEVTLNDGAQFKGVIKYNEQIGSITYKVDSLAKESRTFAEEDIVTLSLNNEFGSLRRFYSFPVKNPENKEVILLFEVVKEFKNWAVLSRKEGIRVLRKKGEQQYDLLTGTSSPNTSAKISQTEYFYIMDEQGAINYFFVSEDQESDGLFASQNSRSKMVDEELFMSMMEPFTSQVESYAKKNKLKSNRKEDLLQILDYYESLVLKK